MAVSFNSAPITTSEIGNTMLQSRSGAISGGNRFINESREVNFKTGRFKNITGVLEKQGNNYSDIYSHIFRSHVKVGNPLGKVEKYARNGNGTKTFLFNGIRRLKLSYKSGKFAGLTLYNSKGLKLGEKLLKALL